MIWSLIYKEWKKTNYYILSILIVGLLFEAYLCLEILRSVRMVGMPHVWDVIINRNAFLFDGIKFFSLSIGVVLGLAQYLPEIKDKRIKLSLHLPLPEHKIIFTMVIYGQIVMILFSFIFMGFILLFTSFYFPCEIVTSVLLTILPWFLSGIVVNNLLAWICIEPTWKRRIFNIILSFIIINLFFISDYPSSYVNILIYIWIIIPLLIPSVLISVYRFKEGKQD